KLLERIDSHVRVRADADPDRPRADALDGEESVAEVGLRRRARAHARTRACEEVQLVAVRVRRVDDRRPRREAVGSLEELDRTEAVLGEALLDLARLFVRVDVQRQLVR